MNSTPHRDSSRPIRRVLFFGKSHSVSGTTRGIVAGLREQGLEVRWANTATLKRWLGRKLMGTWLRRLCERYRPDLFFSFLCDMPSDLLEDMAPRCRAVVWNEDLFPQPLARLRPWLEHSDLMCLSNRGQIGEYLRLGARRVEFVMSAFSPAVHRPAPAPPGGPRMDLAFIGSPGLGDGRARMVLRAADRWDVHVFGEEWEQYRRRSRRLHIHRPVRPRRFARVCAAARIVLGMNADNSVPLYFSNRTWMTLGCRGFHLTHYVPGLEEVFEEGRHLAWFSDFDEMVEKIARYLPDQEERDRIASEGYRYALAHHTYSHRMGQVLALLGRPAVEPAVQPHVLPQLAPVRQEAPGVVLSRRSHLAR